MDGGLVGWDRRIRGLRSNRLLKLGNHAFEFLDSQVDVVFIHVVHNDSVKKTLTGERAQKRGMRAKAGISRKIQSCRDVTTFGCKFTVFFSGFFITPIIVIFGENTDPCVIPADRKKLARIEPQAR